MEFRILGPLEVADPSGPVRLGGPKQRALLALLVVNRGQAVSTDRLVDELWGERPPPTAVKTVHTYISQLRRLLGEGVLVTRARAYALEVPAESIDAERFAELAARGREQLAAGNAREASATLRAALALWRGPALADLAYEPFAQPVIARLEETRLATTEDAVDADLALERHAELVPELENLVRENPLRERICAQLMLALYGSGRQAEALRVYRETRRRLVDELGIEPGPALKETEHAILAQDPALASTRARRDTAAAVSRRGAAGRLLWIGGALLLAAAIAAATFAVRRGGDVPRLAAVAPNSVAVIDADARAVVAEVPVGAGPVALSAASDRVWVVNGADRTVSRIDARSRRVVATVGTGHVGTTIALDAGAVWLANAAGGGGRGTLTRLDPASGAVRTTVVRPSSEGDLFAPATPSAIAVGREGIWVNRLREQVVRVSPATGAPADAVDLGGRRSADGLALAAGSLWVTSGADDSVLRIDPRRRRVVSRIPIAAAPGRRLAGPLGIVAGESSIWIANAISGTVSRLDPRVNAITATIKVGRRPTRVAVGADAVWALNAGDGTVSRIDPASNTVTDTVRVGTHVTDLAATADAVWVAVAGGRPESGAPPARPVRALPRSVCSRMLTAPGAEPDVLIASDLPARLGGPSEETAQMRTAVRLVLEQRGFRAGRHRVAFQACDSSTREEGYTDPNRCAANARVYARHRSLVGVVGPYHSFCAAIELPTLNAATGGPLAMVAPSTTYAGLTRAGPATAADEPDRFAPTGARSFARVVAPDDRQDMALAILAKRLGGSPLYVLHHGQGTGYAHAVTVAHAARRIGVKVAGIAAWDPEARGYAGLAERVARTRPRAVVVAGCYCENGRRLLSDLRKPLGPRVRFLAPDMFLDATLLLGDDRAVTAGLYFTQAGLPDSRLPARGADLREDLRKAGHDPIASFAIYAAAATEVLLDAIARSDGSRASVTRNLLDVRIRDGVVGDLRFDPAGDPIPAAFTAYRVSPGAPTHRPPRRPQDQGAVVDRVIVPPARAAP